MELFSALLVRLSGFSANRLEPLRLDRACAALEALDLARSGRAEAGRALDDALSQERLSGNLAFDDPEERKRLRALLRRTREHARHGGELVTGELEEIGRVFPACALRSSALAAAALCEREAEAEYAAAHRTDLERAREALAALFSDPALREAVLLQSREAFRRLASLHAAPGPRDARARQRERVAALYAQRFCAKNDTNSLCGPHAAAFFADVERDPVRLSAGPALSRRRAYFSHWAAEALLSAWAARCGARPRPRKNPLSRREGDWLAFCRMDLSQPSGWRRRHGRLRPPPELWSAVESGEPCDVLEAAVEAGVALDAPGLPVGSFVPLDDAGRALVAFPEGPARDEAQGQLAELRAQLDRFERGDVAARVEASAALDAAFERAAGGPASRGHAQHYADRWLVHEDCAAQVEVSLGAGARDRLAAALEPLVDACALPMERAREATRAWFAGRFGARRVPALEALRGFDQDAPAQGSAATPLGRAIEVAIGQVQRLVAFAAAERGGRIDPEALRRASAVPGLRARPGFASADLLLGRREGAPPLWVVGELHGFLFFPTCLLDVVPERDRVLEAMRATLREVAGGRRTVEPVLLHLDATARRFPVADADLELVGFTSRPESHRLGDLDLLLEGGELRFLDGDREVVPATVYENVPFLDYTSRLGPLYDHYQSRYFPDALLPEALRDAAPRLTLGEDVVVRRACRRVPVASAREALEAPSDAARFARARRWEAALGLGDRVFASVSGEPKPLMVDARNPFLLEALLHVLERAPEGGAVNLSEMLPAPEALLLQGPDGPRTSELRLGLVRRPQEGTADA